MFMDGEADQKEEMVSESLPQEQPKHRERVWEIDFLRGAAILGMVIDHLLYDLSALDSYFYNFNEVASEGLKSFVKQMNSYFFGPVRYFFHSLACLFFVMSGISCSFSRSNFKHGGKILLFAGLITLFTYSLYFITYAMGSAIDIRILFGVLYVLGMGVLLVAVIQKIPGSKWIELGLGLAILTFGFIYPVLTKYKGAITDWPSFWEHIFFFFDASPWVGFYKFDEAPDWFAKLTGFDVPTFFKSMFGFAQAGSDYFSFIPWVGFTLIGAFLGQTIYKEKKSLLPRLNPKWHRPVDWFGSKSLYVYALHQPFWLIVLLLIFLPMGFRMF